MKNIFLLIVLSIFVPVSSALGACLGSSPNWTAASCNNNVTDGYDVTDCIVNNASLANGDIVNIPTGNCTWDTGVIVPKNITIKGAGVGNTVITTPVLKGISLRHTSTRVTGLELYNVNISFEGVGFRIDHNKLVYNIDTSGAGTVSVNVGSDVMYQHPTGLIDNNEFINVKVQVYGGAISYKTNTEWTMPNSLGLYENVIYIEDNIFSRNDDLFNILDGNYAGMYVFRYNTVYGSYLMSHSIKGAHRGFKKFEIYGNIIERNPALGVWSAMFLRGGTGVVFNNIIKGEWTNSLLLDNRRDVESTSSLSGLCDGLSSWDGNYNDPVDGVTGYPCRDQIGMGKDAVLWSWDEPVGSHTQEHDPAYFWGNNHETDGPVVADVASYSQLHIKPNRDYFEYNPSYDGITEIGTYCGNALPANCTVNDGAWITNQSCVNMAEMIGVNPTTPIDGTLYKCTAENVWTEHFTPYEYPHPLRGSATAQRYRLRVVTD